MKERNVIWLVKKNLSAGISPHGSLDLCAKKQNSKKDIMVKTKPMQEHSAAMVPCVNSKPNTIPE
jgi:hypothetical protein